MPTLTGVLITGGIVAATVPVWPKHLSLIPFMAFAACHLGSYALSDAALMERVTPAVRGRVVGLFLTIAGVFGSLGSWVMGKWTDLLGPAASSPHAYFAPFSLVAAMMFLAAFSPPLIAKLGEADQSRIDPIAETLPATMDVV